MKATKHNAKMKSDVVERVFLRDDDLWGTDGAFFESESAKNEFLSKMGWEDDGRCFEVNIPEELRPWLAEWADKLATYDDFEWWLGERDYQIIDRKIVQVTSCECGRVTGDDSGCDRKPLPVSEAVTVRFVDPSARHTVGALNGVGGWGGLESVLKLHPDCAEFIQENMPESEKEWMMWK